MEPQDSPTTFKGDRIGDLPDTILHHILCLVDLKLAVQTSVLSTRWRYFWKSLPILNFNSKQFKVTRKNFSFIEFVDKVLHLRDSSSHIQSLNLSCSGIFDITCYLRNWISIALNQKVQELYLDITLYKFGFPLCLLTCKWLKVLSLKYSANSGYSYNLYLSNSMSLPSLKTLALYGFLFEVGDIPTIFLSCPNLESLTITHCSFNEVRFDISSLKLKHLVIEDCYNYCRVKLFAPSLISVHIGDYLLNDYCFENLSALVKAEIDMNYVAHGPRKEMYVEGMVKFLTTLENVKTLTLWGSFLQVFSGAPALLECTSTQFCNLRCLKLETCLSRDCIHAMTYLLENSPNIESLFVQTKVVKTRSLDRCPF